MKISPLIGYIPVVIILILISLKIVDYHGYHRLVNEDGFVENLTFLFFCLASLISLTTVKTLAQHSTFRWPYIALFSAFAVIYMFIAFEEISWGQRILGLTTPERLMKINVQDEITVHNISFIHNITMDIYILIGCWGSFGWILLRSNKISSRIKYSLFIPHHVLILYFMPILISSFYLEYGRTVIEALFAVDSNALFYFVERVDNEPCELIMSMGFFIFMLINHRNIKESTALNKLHKKETAINSQL